MIKLNRTTEYGLIALRHMSRKRTVDPQGVTSAREVAEAYGLPYEITAKTLQRLKDRGVIDSEKGVKGGYHLAKSLGEISLTQFLEIMEGPQGLVACVPTQGGESCDYHGRCEIRGLLSGLNARVHEFLSTICLSELAENSSDRFPIQRGERNL